MQFYAAMGFALRTLLTTVACSVVVFGCAPKRTRPLAQSASPQPSTPVVAAASDVSVEKEKRPRFGESVVYIDGKPVGVIRSTELPLSLKARHIDLGGGYSTIRYGFLDYARALGVDAKRVKAMHIYGGSRVAVVERDDLTRVGDRITFEFVQGTRGKPRVDWPAAKFRLNTRVDMVSNVAFYVEKEPPILKDRQLVMPDGSPIKEKVPYAPEEQGNGTRVYVDGALIGTVKRKKITDDILVSPDTNAKAKTDTDTVKDVKLEDRFSLLGYAEKLRADAKQVKSVDLVAGDDVIAHLTSDDARALTFNVPARNRGQAVVDLVQKNDTEKASARARVSAIQIYVNLTPPARPIVKLDDASEAALGSGQGGSGADDDL
jgi:hypothetical protein